jgi:hypothetical protein
MAPFWAEAGESSGYATITCVASGGGYEYTWEGSPSAPVRITYELLAALTPFSMPWPLREIEDVPDKKYKVFVRDDVAREG